MKIPPSIVSKVDLSRIVRELEMAHEQLQQADLRGTDPSLPVLSRALQDMAELHETPVDSLEAAKKLLTELTELQRSAPRLHISFAHDPNPEFLSKLITWLRDEIHPQLLLRIGLQPSIAGGCIVRTTNKIFDFSLRRDLDAKHQILIDKLRSAA